MRVRHVTPRAARPASAAAAASAPAPDSPTATGPAAGLGGDNCFPAAAAQQMERLVADFGRMYQERNEALQAIARAHRETLLRLARLAEYRDDETGSHLVRIGFIAWALACKLGEPAEFALRLRQAAPMHDIGKVGIPDAVLKKPGAYTEEERAVIRRHPEIGAGILGRSGIPLFDMAADVALTHHERWDGHGYPHRLAGDRIPLAGRITAVADFFDALTMDRCYRPAYPDDKAVEMMTAERGGAFDPRIVDTFLKHRDELVALRDLVHRDRLGFDDLGAPTAEIGTMRPMTPVAPIAPVAPPTAAPVAAAAGPSRAATVVLVR